MSLNDLSSDHVDRIFGKVAKTLSEQPSESASTNVRLELYALYKQATCGDCTAESSFWQSPVAAAKQKAWKAKEGTDGHAARLAYIKLATDGMIAPEKFQQILAECKVSNENVRSNVGS